MVETEFVPKEVQAIGPDKGHRGWRFFGLWNVRRHGGLHAVAAKAFLAMKGAGAISGSRARVLLVNSHPDTWFSEYIVEVEVDGIRVTPISSSEVPEALRPRREARDPSHR
jgi:hypothetical protein